ncbi:MAG: hypothetical protein WBA11_17535 [Rubrivirga sp.]
MTMITQQDYSLDYTALSRNGFMIPPVTGRVHTPLPITSKSRLTILEMLAISRRSTEV